jgi:4-carboxymuconolactone decarboxylase
MEDLVSRIENLKVEDFTTDQQALVAEIAGTRARGVGGPFAIWLRNPAVCRPANELGNALRARGKLDKRLFELMVLLVARHWSAQYEWYVHEPAALKAGVREEIVQAIRDGRAPSFGRRDEQLVYDLVTELNERKHVSKETYDGACRELGVDMLIELVSAAGFYTLVAMVLNTFDVEAPEGARPLA